MNMTILMQLLHKRNRNQKIGGKKMTIEKLRSFMKEVHPSLDVASMTDEQVELIFAKTIWELNPENGDNNKKKENQE